MYYQLLTEEWVAQPKKYQLEFLSRPTVATAASQGKLDFNQGLGVLYQVRDIAQNAYCSGDIYLQFTKYLRSVILPIIIHQIFSLAHHWSKGVTWANIPQIKLGNIRGYSPIFKTARVA